MAIVIRVGAGAQVDRFQPDLLEEIRIMAEAAQAPLVQTTLRPSRPVSAFSRMLGAVLASGRRSPANLRA
jgi:hypothetical protein